MINTNMDILVIYTLSAIKHARDTVKEVQLTEVYKGESCRVSC